MDDLILNEIIDGWHYQATVKHSVGTKFYILLKRWREWDHLRIKEEFIEKWVNDQFFLPILHEFIRNWSDEKTIEKWKSGEDV